MRSDPIIFGAEYVNIAPQICDRSEVKPLHCIRPTDRKERERAREKNEHGNGLRIACFRTGSHHTFDRPHNFLNAAIASYREKENISFFLYSMALAPHYVRYYFWIQKL